MTAAVSGAAILSGNRIALSGVTVSSDWIGYWVSIANSYPENAGPWQVLAVESGTVADPGNQILTLNGTLIEDNGLDVSDAGTTVQRRSIVASVSPYYLEARLTDEGGGTNDGPDAAIQCTFCPVPIEVELPGTEELPTGEDQRQYVYLTFHDDISIGRKYRLHARGIEDLYGNACGDVTLDFTSPTFGSPANRLTMWSDGIVAASDRKRDLEHDGYLRKLAVVIQDLINVLWYRVDDVAFLDDAGRCPTDWVDHLLYERGNPFRFPIETETLRRRLASALPGFYKKVGTAPGIVDILKLLLEIEFDVQPYNSADYWRIGFSMLGIETVLGPGTAWARNCYEIVSPVDLTDEQRRIVTTVATWSDPADMHLARIVEPSTSTPVVPSYWTLGYSALGLSTTLGP
jgi:phage tail-like protein